MSQDQALWRHPSVVLVHVLKDLLTTALSINEFYIFLFLEGHANNSSDLIGASNANNGALVEQAL